MQLHIPVQVAWHQQGRGSLTCLRTATCTNNDSYSHQLTRLLHRACATFFHQGQLPASRSSVTEQVLLILSSSNNWFFYFFCINWFFCVPACKFIKQNKQACWNMSPFDQKFKQMRHMLRFKKEQPLIWNEMLRASMLVSRLALDLFACFLNNRNRCEFYWWI